MGLLKKAVKMRKISTAVTFSISALLTATVAFGTHHLRNGREYEPANPIEKFFDIQEKLKSEPIFEIEPEPYIEAVEETCPYDEILRQDQIRMILHNEGGFLNGFMTWSTTDGFNLGFNQPTTQAGTETLDADFRVLFADPVADALARQIFGDHYNTIRNVFVHNNPTTPANFMRGRNITRFAPMMAEWYGNTFPGALLQISNSNAWRGDSHNIMDRFGLGSHGAHKKFYDLVIQYGRGPVHRGNIGRGANGFANGGIRAHNHPHTRQNERLLTRASGVNVSLGQVGAIPMLANGQIDFGRIDTAAAFRFLERFYNFTYQEDRFRLNRCPNNINRLAGTWTERPRDVPIGFPIPGQPDTRESARLLTREQAVRFKMDYARRLHQHDPRAFYELYVLSRINAFIGHAHRYRSTPPIGTAVRKNTSTGEHVQGSTVHGMFNKVGKLRHNTVTRQNTALTLDDFERAGIIDPPRFTTLDK